MPDKVSGVLTRRKITFGCNHVAANVADTIATATSSTPLRDRNRVEHSDTPPFYSPTTISHLHQHLVAPSHCLTLLFQAPNNPIIYFIGPVPINRLGLASTSSSSATLFPLTEPPCDADAHIAKHQQGPRSYCNCEQFQHHIYRSPRSTSLSDVSSD